MGITERKEREKEQRRNDILDAAERVFFKKGLEQATMDDIANKAELSKGTLYLYFKSKEELYFAIGIRAHQILWHMFEKVISPDKKVMDNIFEIGKAFVRFANEYPDYFRTMVHFEADFDMHYITEQHKRLFQTEEDPMALFVEILQNGIDNGVLRNDISASQLAHILWTQTTGVLKLASTKDFHPDLHNVSDEEIIMNHFEILKYGLLKNQ
ncbi:MAG: TetR/AcrR family transcriptional regulator [Bacteroidales bacterium]|nr:TetR/AcrR family transcriptional regulator [Bacteroidales bacterium]MBN2761487.1 TetR/AcrR family transcriptional regulator [Bacteroidales bacterium]